MFEHLCDPIWLPEMLKSARGECFDIQYWRTNPEE